MYWLESVGGMSRSPPAMPVGVIQSGGKTAELSAEAERSRVRMAALADKVREGLQAELDKVRGELAQARSDRDELARQIVDARDMVGALAVIGDLVKTRVYAICRWLNRGGEMIPWAILEKPPSAELCPGQKDTDSLPPYDVLDPIVEAYVERYETPERIAEASRGVD